MEAREVEEDAHIGAMLRAMASSRKIFSLSSGRSRADFFRRVAALSKGLRELIQYGERVAIAALTSEYYLEWMLAVPCAGGIVTPLNYRWSFDEANAAIQLVRPAILVLDEQCRHWALRGESIMRCNGETETNLDLCFAPNNIALICFTSGTTGTPKGVSLTHRALVAQSLAKLAIVGYSSMDVYLHTAPLCHIGGISSVLAMVMAGSQQLFLPKFETSAVLQALKDYEISTMIVVPTMLRDILEPGKSGSDQVFPSMLTILNGGGSVPSRLLPAVKKTFPNARLFSAYGMTEACSSMTFLRLDGHVPLGVGSCVGKPPPHVQVGIKDGRIFTRGPHVMHGYWGQTIETAGVLQQDGWLDTGDIGKIDKAGNLWLLGRAKDVVKTGGENVYASEVEMVLSQHPSVSSVAVVGVPESRLSEIVAAVVRLHDGWTWSISEHPMTVSESDLRLHCSKQGLSRYKIPKLIVQRQDPFPVTSTGKVRKDMIKAGLSKL
ncbi:2-succinylbenzoate--CoA ligase, chloroplastic/peroxisomal [Selaginella moellendorffii]|uniref:2-succinylbenzoate--CoA ligase, chloroplastic/peroxisomal n=1 Tax=Selaginella moellendorffii TaxID=88036 RepID=UPI000D1C21A0|nr:2-succinylbenzoate--CoA ligase, chloroplastic/peroxisomal [Selaginella moellendorffii]|eukprot:XP_024529289.1 2-succinylbenzoate--CoA ligase, chloroplastic/peroxisomal [Selaginella moellendorffii]